MALIKCPECGKEISEKAKFCPNCGEPMQTKKKTEDKKDKKQNLKNGIRKPKNKKILFALIIIAIIICACVFGVLYFKDVFIKNKATIHNKEGVVEKLSHDELEKLCDENKVKFEKLYDGAIIEFVDKIESISDDYEVTFESGWVVELLEKPKNYDHSSDSYSNTYDLSDFDKGDKIRVKSKIVFNNGGFIIKNYKEDITVYNYGKYNESRYKTHKEHTVFEKYSNAKSKNIEDEDFEEDEYLEEDSADDYDSDVITDEADSISEDERQEIEKIDVNRYLSLKKENKASLIYVMRTGCSWCALEDPIIENVKYKYKDAPMHRLDIADFNDDEMDKFNKSDSLFSGNEWGTPTIIIVKNDKVLDSVTGATTSRKIISMMKKNKVI